MKVEPGTHCLRMHTQLPQDFWDVRNYRNESNYSNKLN